MDELFNKILAAVGEDDKSIAEILAIIEEVFGDFIPKELLTGVFSFRLALNLESDRGCALFVAAYLDEALKTMLLSSLVCSDKDKLEKDMFLNNAAFYTFSSRIHAAYYLGKISQSTLKDLNIIRSIRNRFAHDISVSSFEDQSIYDKCKNLTQSYHSKDASPRSHFTAAAFSILAALNFQTFDSKPIPEMTTDIMTEKYKSDFRTFLDKLF